MMRSRGRGYLCTFLLSILLSLCLSGCQTSAVMEEAGRTQSVEEKGPEDRTDVPEEDIEELEEAEEDEYIDADYVADHYGDEEEEDFSAYSDKKAGSEAGSGSNKGSSSENGIIRGTGDATEQDQYQTDPVPEGEPEPMEPQDASIDYDTQYSCTLYVECSAILNNWEDLTEGKEDLVPSNGVIYGRRTVTFNKGESVYDILQREMQNSRIHMEASFTPAYNSAYVEGINNLYEFDCGSHSGWMYCVNGWYPNYGCSRYQVSDGDRIEWHYTCDLGRDL